MCRVFADYRIHLEVLTSGEKYALEQVLISKNWGSLFWRAYNMDAVDMKKFKNYFNITRENSRKY